MYIREIPADELPEVREIMQRNKSNLLIPDADLKRLFYFYYRYIKSFSRGQDAVKQMNKDYSCRACKGKVIMYFRNLEL